MSDPFIYNPIKIVLTVVIAFLPAILYSIIIRYSERFDRNPWGSIGQAFLWGATLSLVLVIIIRGFFRVEIFPNYEWASDEGFLRLIIICLITPVFAEILKPIGLYFVGGDILEAEDGLIFGAVIGCGYTATENLMFGIYLAPLYGVDIFITVVFVRTMSVMFVHSSATALTCYGITRAMKIKHKSGRFLAFPLFLLAGILIHAGFNYFAYMDMFNVGDVNILVSVSSSVLFSVIFALLLLFIIYFKIHRLDTEEIREAKKVDKEAARLREERPLPPRTRQRPRSGQRGRPRQRQIPMSQQRGRPPPMQRSMRSQPFERDNYYDYPEDYEYSRGMEPRRGPSHLPSSTRVPGSNRSMNGHYDNNYPSRTRSARPPHTRPTMGVVGGSRTRAQASISEPVQRLQRPPGRTLRSTHGQRGPLVQTGTNQITTQKSTATPRATQEQESRIEVIKKKEIKDSEAYDYEIEVDQEGLEEQSASKEEETKTSSISIPGRVPDETGDNPIIKKPKIVKPEEEKTGADIDWDD
jgi:RsiW-degrading membrane proteinase PrsW (M82 family)